MVVVCSGSDSGSGIEDEDGFMPGEQHSTIDSRSVVENTDDDDEMKEIERLAAEMKIMFEEEKEAEELAKHVRYEPRKEEGMSRDINADSEAVREEARIYREELEAEERLLRREKEMKAKLDDELLKLKSGHQNKVEILSSDHDDDDDDFNDE